MASPTPWHEFEQTPGDSDRQGRPECCSPWGRRVGRDLGTERPQRDKPTEFVRIAVADHGASGGSASLSPGRGCCPKGTFILPLLMFPHFVRTSSF